MTRATCPRAWEAEAIQDGRLDALAAASFERHVAQCEECAREAKGLRELCDAFGRLEPRRPSLLEQRRQRAELLRRANERIVTRREGQPRLLVMAAVAVLVALAVGFVAFHRRSTPPVTSSAPAFELRAIDRAAFRDETRGPNGHVVLSSGSLAVHVERLRPGQTFVLAVPDGELAVHGTRFIVEVENGQTYRVLVTEGVVAVRLSGFPERMLLSGESWTRPSPPPPVADGDVLVDAVNDAALGRQSRDAGGPAVAVRLPRHPTNARAEHGGADASGRVAASVPRERAAAQGATPRRGDDAVAAALPENGEPSVTDRVTAPREFAAAMAAFSSGAYLDADERFAAFSAHFPSDARQEDTAFLRAVIATRRGDAAAAVARARDYLRRFPSGLRRVEMERLANAPW